MLTPEQLSELKSELVDALRNPSPWMDRAKAAAYLSVSMETIDLCKRSGTLKPKYVGGKPLYHQKDLDALPQRK